jgi:hypothetical protein
MSMESTPKDAKDEKDEVEKTKESDKKTDKADKKAEKKADKAAKKAAPKAKKPLPKFVVPLVCAIVALAVGLGIGYFAFGGAASSGSGAVSGKTTVSKSDLDATMATYTYKGVTYKVTVRDVINSTSSLSAQKQSDGTYKIPSTDGVLSYARSEIIEQAAKEKGLTVSAKEMKSYAESTIGSSDYATIASNYGMSKSTVKKLIKQSALMQKLRNKVVKTKSVSAPTAPTQPSDGNTQTASADYAKYIINLAGDEWDATKGTWSGKGGTYETALKSYTITSTSATYEAAQAAYYVAYQQYSTNQTKITTEWTNYVNKLLCNAKVNMVSLVA